MLALISLLGCSDQVRISNQEIIGTWATNISTGREQLTFRSDGTFQQVFSSARNQFTNEGKWESNNQFFGGTELTLTGFRELEGESGPGRQATQLLQVYRVEHSLKLARNAAADWYYERVQ